MGEEKLVKIRCQRGLHTPKSSISLHLQVGYKEKTYTMKTCTRHYFPKYWIIVEMETNDKNKRTVQLESNIKQDQHTIICNCVFRYSLKW